MTAVAGIDPRTAQPLPTVAEESTASDVDTTANGAARSAAALVDLGRTGRAQLLEAIADAVEASRAELVGTAAAETGFPTTKLEGELTRTVFQFRFFAEVIREGGYLEAMIDTAGDTPMGPRPDLRRLLVPIGPVAVFGASNFPFAFSVLGGDTASAVAAGCPVVAKAHDSHPATSKLSFDILAQVAHDQALPDTVFGIVFGRDAGANLVAHPAVRAVGFTGSLAGGRALLGIIDRRDDPIPFYGELSSLNPVIVTPGAAAERADEIGAAVVASFTLGAGQLCTKPGLVLVPDNADGDRLLSAVRHAVADVAAQPLLNEGILRSYQQELSSVAKTDLVTTAGPPAEQPGFWAHALVVETDVAALTPELVHETFAPVTVVARYPAADPVSAVTAVTEVAPPSLTASIHHGHSEDQLTTDLVRLLTPTAGRIIFNGFPTGVAVSWSQHHGGPWPSTNTLHTSVGATAIRRFLRPVTYQNAPQAVLPAELRDGYDEIPLRRDGVLCTPEKK
jgi:NADP-dependent aldehyde dehydrogenase